MSRISAFAGATLTVSLTESLTIDGRDYGGSQSIEVPSITDVSRRIVTVLHSAESNLWLLGTASTAGTSVIADTMYMRFTNLDDTNHVTLTFKNADDDEFAVKVDKGQSFLVFGDAAGGMAGMADAIDGTGISLSLNSITAVIAIADTASVDMELYVASK
jgi:hypothetical protein